MIEDENSKPEIYALGDVEKLVTIGNVYGNVLIVSPTFLSTEFQNPLIAQAGSFLRRLFVPDGSKSEIGIHFTGYLREEALKSVRFNFYFTIGREMSVDSATLGKWCRLTDTESVILFHIEKLPNRTVYYRFRELTYWMVIHPEWVDDISRNPVITFRLDEFTIVDGTGANFTNAIRVEANRVLKRKSLLEVRQSILIPTGFSSLFYHLGRLTEIEVPEQVVQEAIKSNYISDEQAGRFLRSLTLAPEKHRAYLLQRPYTQEWLRQFMRSYSKENVDRERKQFGLFVRSMINYYRGTWYAMPRFKYEDLSCWRIFVQLFPASFPLIETVLKYPNYWPRDQIMATFLLASTLTNADDKTLVKRAANLLPILTQQLNASRVNDYNQYKVLREYYFTCAESGDRHAVDRCIDFMHHHPVDWDLSLNQEYYSDSTNSSLERAVRRKLLMPKSRDIQTIRLSEMMLERITNRPHDR